MGRTDVPSPWRWWFSLCPSRCPQSGREPRFRLPGLRVLLLGWHHPGTFLGLRAELLGRCHLEDGLLAWGMTPWRVTAVFWDRMCAALSPSCFRRIIRGITSCFLKNGFKNEEGEVVHFDLQSALQCHFLVLIFKP